MVRDAKPRDFRGLDVWRKSHELATHVYAPTSRFPASEQFGLTSQIRRSAVSIPSNIAEGCGRGGDVELARKLYIGLGRSRWGRPVSLSTNYF